ncbi:hypothetical protein IWW56_004351 [Coemansia sp. RSA 2131]|nr:hypothetical protein IWW56_004351 [Coemansia sp. RSA 2131]
MTQSLPYSDLLQLVHCPETSSCAELGIVSFKYGDNESGHQSLDSFFSELESLSNIDDVTGLPEFSNIFPSGLPSDFPSVIPGDIPSDLPSGIPSNLPIDPIPSSVEDASVENSSLYTEESSSSVQYYTTYGTSELDEIVNQI